MQSGLWRFENSASIPYFVAKKNVSLNHIPSLQHVSQLNLWAINSIFKAISLIMKRCPWWKVLQGYILNPDNNLFRGFVFLLSTSKMVVDVNTLFHSNF